MTPKDKAKELLDKFRNEFKWVEIDYSVDLYRDTKQCALIAVDEILSLSMIGNMGRGMGELMNEFEYWTAVKEEIEKL